MADDMAKKRANFMQFMRRRTAGGDDAAQSIMGKFSMGDASYQQELIDSWYGSGKGRQGLDVVYKRVVNDELAVKSNADIGWFLPSQIADACAMTIDKVGSQKALEVWLLKEIELNQKEHGTKKEEGVKNLDEDFWHRKYWYVSEGPDKWSKKKDNHRWCWLRWQDTSWCWVRL